MKKIPVLLAALSCAVVLTTNIAAAGANTPSFATPDAATFTTSPWSSTGLEGTGPVDDTVNGDNYFINNFYSATDRWLETYMVAGSAIHLAWHVTGSNGAVLANQPVTLISNLSYSCSNGVTWSTSSLNVNPGCGGGADGTLSGTTDTNGNVSFTLTNTNTATGTRPTDLTSTGAAEANESGYPWTRFVLQVGSDVFTANPNTTVNQATDLVDFILLP